MKQCSLSPRLLSRSAPKASEFSLIYTKENRIKYRLPGKSFFKMPKKRRAAESPFKEILQLCRTVDILLCFQFHLPFSGAQALNLRQ